MKMAIAAMAGLAALALSGPVQARGGLGEAGEAEAARANARAGGPTNYRDAELLERYGCRDSRDSRFCRERETRRRHQARYLRGDYRH